MKESIAEKIAKTVSVICGLVMIWGVVSWADVICHNASDYSYAVWNLFTILF